MKVKDIRNKIFNAWFLFFGQKRAQKFWDAILMDDTLQICLIAKYVNINHRFRDNKTFLHHAVKLDLYDSIETLLSLGAEVNTIGEMFYETPLFAMVHKKDQRGARLLLEAGANPFIGSMDYNAVNIAVRFGESDMLSLLLTHCIEEYLNFETLNHLYNFSRSKEINSVIPSNKYDVCTEMLKNFIDEKFPNTFE